MNPVDAIRQLLEKYFDALYRGDADLFAEVLHPKGRLFCSTDGQLLVMDVPEYLDVVRRRESPASRNDRREDEIVSIEVPTPTTAHVRVKELFLPKHFTDELTLLFVDDRWRIVSKVWHFTVEADA
jgi:Putative lumazine-binding